MIKMYKNIKENTLKKRHTKFYLKALVKFCSTPGWKTCQQFQKQVYTGLRMSLNMCILFL